MERRDFLKAGAAGGAAALAALVGDPAWAVGAGVAIVADADDRAVQSAQVQWAVGRLRHALEEAGHRTQLLGRITPRHPYSIVVRCAGDGAPVATGMLRAAHASLGAGPERMALVAGSDSGCSVILATGTDPAGIAHAILNLTVRVREGRAAELLFGMQASVVRQPANPVCSVMRQFTSETLDKPWFGDREMWAAYLTMLAESRFNRLHLAFGLGYDSLQRVEDSYFLFLYPFLLDVPGYGVRVTNLTTAERDRNLETLRWIADETAARGLTFQLGIWMHGYALADSPRARYVVEGLTPATHAAYCRDALTAVLRACPAIGAVALRIHGESGVAEGSYDFWQTVFGGVARAGRPIEIDLHSKGLDHEMIRRALATGMPVNVSPKYWAEHLGLPYHQSAIRALEMPVEGRTGNGLMTLSEGSLSFTRYGYADFLRDDRRYTVRHRVFAGTQRLLMSADPESTAGYARAFGFCGSTGMDLMEPLTCRGRRGTGSIGGRRTGYADAALEPKWDWQKYALWYRVWGELTYDPAAAPDLRRVAENAIPAPLASALARASRVLPLVTTAYTPSAACDAYWPEIYWNQPLTAEPRPNPYGDTLAPKTFHHASPLDPQLFAGMSEHAGELLSGERSGRYSPIDVAHWLETLAVDIDGDLQRIPAAGSADVRRILIDVRMQAALARFFAAKFRAGVLFAIHERTRSQQSLDAATGRYRAARDAWAGLIDVAKGIYADDLSVSDKVSERGQWADRLAAIDADIDAMTARPAARAGTQPDGPAISVALGAPPARPASIRHSAVASFRPGSDVTLTVETAAARVTSVRCYYRRVNQAERFIAVDMRRDGARLTAVVPGAYTTSPFPLQYYFVTNERSADAALFPGLGDDLRGQPYFVVQRQA